MKKLSKVVIIVLACLIAISSVSLGKVFAYFSAKSSASGTVTMGHLSISDIKKSDGTDINWNIANLQPNQSFGGSYKVEVTSNINYYVRLLFKASVTPLSGKTHATNCGDEVTDDTDILNIVIDGAYSKSSEKTTDGYTAYYKLSPTTVTSATTTETFNIDLKAQNWVGSGSCDYYMGATVSINLQAEVMQADYLNSQNAGGTVSSAGTMHTLWSGIMEPVEDISAYPNLTFTVLDSTAKTMSVAAANTSITSANIPALVKKNGEIYSITTIASIAFHNCTNLTSVTIPNSVIDVFHNAFSGCSSLQYNTYDTAHYLGNTSNPYLALIKVTSTNIASCIINPNCKLLASDSFDNCSSLTLITIPSGLIDIYVYSFFESCSSLTSINVDDNHPTYSSEDGVLFNKDKSRLIFCPRGKTGSYNIPNSVTSIDGCAFAWCTGISSINIPSSVTTIGQYAFATARGNYDSYLVGVSYYNTSSTTTITYTGTVAQMTAIHSTFPNVKSKTCYTIVCNDGNYIVKKANLPDK